MAGRLEMTIDRGGELVGYIKTRQGIFMFLGRDLRNYRGQDKHEFGLIPDTIVSFENDDGMARDVVVEGLPSKMSMAREVSLPSLAGLVILLSLIGLSLYYKDFAVFFLVMLLGSLVVSIIFGTYQELKRIFK